MTAAANRDFRLFQGTKLLTTVADQMLSVAVGWQLYDLTGRAFDLGLVGLVQFLPAFFLSLPAGHTTDRFDRRKVVMICSSILVIAAGLLWASTHEGARAWHIYAAMLLFASARTFLDPAEQALLPDIVPVENFTSAIAWSSTASEIGAIGGPALGGLIYSAGHGAWAVYITGAFLYLMVVVLTGAMAVRTGRMETQAPSIKTVLAGVVYVWKNKILLGAISLDLFAVLFGGAVALLPVYARDILHTGPWGLGLLRSAMAVGAMSMAVILAIRPFKRRTGATMLVAVAVFGLATVVFGASRSFVLSMLALVIAGASDMVSVVVRQTLVQIVTPPEMRGRVSAVNMVFIGASNQLGALESGMAAAWLGTVPAVVVGGFAAVVVVAAYSVFFPGLRKVDRLDAVEPELMTA